MDPASAHFLTLDMTAHPRSVSVAACHMTVSVAGSVVQCECMMCVVGPWGHQSVAKVVVQPSHCTNPEVYIQ